MIKEHYRDIINNGIVPSSVQKEILKYWEEYYNQYKTDEEKIIVDKINKQLKYAFKKNRQRDYKKSLKNIKYLIKHEVNSAYKQRKAFLSKYNAMENYLLYAQIIISLLVVGFTIFIIFQAIRQNKHLTLLTEQYRVEANTDGLTKLYNRKYFDTIFKDLAQISYENDVKSVFVMIDIDFFKQYNDTYGHDAGDIALKKVAYVLDRCLDKEYEYTFRLGGEEFGIIIYNTNLKYVQFTLNNVQHNIKNLKIEHSASKTGILTLSMGVIMIDRNNYKLSPKTLYTQADKKLYYSKENGRNQYTI
jgi:diguanylate cyclase (GGDEF)-like protein